MQGDVASVAPTMTRPRPSGASFYFVMGLIAVGIAIIGFSPGLLVSRVPRHGPPTSLVWLHSGLAVCWLALYLTQTFLIRHGKREVHGRLGWVGAPLALLLVAVGWRTTVELGRRGFALWWDPEQKLDALGEMVHPLVDLVTFGVLVTAAVLSRKRPAVHKRLMLLATVGSLMAAPIAHLIGYFPVLRGVPPIILLPLGLLYFSSAIHDKLAYGRIHAVSLWGGLALFAVAFLRGAFLGPSTIWHQFAGWLVG